MDVVFEGLDRALRKSAGQRLPVTSRGNSSFPPTWSRSAIFPRAGSKFTGV